MKALIYFVSLILMLTKTVYAGETIPINISFINKLNITGSVIYNNDYSHNGPIVERNGGISNTTYNAKYDDLLSISILFASVGYPCLTPEGHALTINPNIYRGDTLTIIISELIDKNGWEELICDCSGSSCDQSFKTKYDRKAYL